jgi:hypothetical protein
MTATTTTSTLTAASLALFLELAGDAPNWSGSPCLNGNVEMNTALKGNLTDLKKNGLLTTYCDEGCTWVQFTEAGMELMRAHGVWTGWAREVAS